MRNSTLSIFTILGICLLGVSEPPTEETDGVHTEYRTTALHSAVDETKLNDIVRLIEEGAIIDAQDHRGRTPLMLAVSQRINLKHSGEEVFGTIFSLLEAKPQLEIQDKHGFTALMHAMRWGEFKSVEMLLDAGVSLDARLLDGVTPLMWAAENCHPLFTVALIKAGADYRARDNEGRTVFMYAVQRKTPAWLWTGDEVEGELGKSIVDLLLEKGIELEAKSKIGWTPLAYAAEPGSLLYVSQLLEVGADPTALGWTPLHIAAAVQDKSLLSANLTEHADLEARDMWGRTPIMWVAHQTYMPSNQSTHFDGNNEFLERFIQAGSDIEVRDYAGRTALMLASEYAGTDNINTLLNAGANINVVDDEGQTPLMFTANNRFGYYNTKHLIESGANIDLQDQKGMTALIHAVSIFHVKKCKLLIEAGARIDLKDLHGKNALEYATTNSSEEYPWYLESRWIAQILNNAKIIK